MIDPTSELGRLLGHASSGGASVSISAPTSELVASCARRYLSGLSVAVVGRAGVGRDTMARALRERLSVAALGPGEDETLIADADLWIQVILGVPRADDWDLWAQLPPDRRIVVLGKADTVGDAATVAAVTAEISAVMGVAVIPISALLACADVTENEWEFLRELSAAGEQVPSMAGYFLLGDMGSRERTLRRALLRRLDQFGIETALDLMETRGAVTDAAELNTALHHYSGITAVRAAIADRVDRIRHWRGIAVRDRLERAAADACARDEIERLLRTPAVTW